MSEKDLEEVKELTLIALAASLPANVRWLDARAVGAQLGYSARYVTEHLVCRADFPKPSRKTGRPRWKVSEIDAWMDNDLNRAA